MTAPVPHRPATYEDLMRVPDNLVAELIGGELYTSPRPRGPHGTVAARLAGLLIPPFDFGDGGPGGWWLIGEPEVHWGPRADQQVTVPDLAGWRRERMPEIPTDHRFRVVPDWICEIASPSTVRLDRYVKMPLYAEHGVGHLWMIDVEARVLEVFRLENGRWLLLAIYSGEQSINAEPFEAIDFRLERLWP